MSGVTATLTPSRQRINNEADCHLASLTLTLREEDELIAVGGNARGCKGSLNEALHSRAVRSAAVLCVRVRGGAPLYGECETAEQDGKAARSLAPSFGVPKVGEEALEKGGGATEEGAREAGSRFIQWRPDISPLVPTCFTLSPKKQMANK